MSHCMQGMYWSDRSLKRLSILHLTLEILLSQVKQLPCINRRQPFWKMLTQGFQHLIKTCMQVGSLSRDRSIWSKRTHFVHFEELIWIFLRVSLKTEWKLRGQESLNSCRRTSTAWHGGGRGRVCRVRDFASCWMGGSVEFSSVGWHRFSSQAPEGTEIKVIKLEWESVEEKEVKSCHYLLAASPNLAMKEVFLSVLSASAEVDGVSGYKWRSCTQVTFKWEFMIMNEYLREATFSSVTGLSSWLLVEREGKTLFTVFVKCQVYELDLSFSKESEVRVMGHTSKEVSPATISARELEERNLRFSFLFAALRRELRYVQKPVLPILEEDASFSLMSVSLRLE